MALATKVTIQIAGQEIPDFTEVVIQERMMNHHSFELICRMENIEGPENYSMDKSQDYIGEQILISINADSPKRKGTHNYRGIITEVMANRSYGDYGDSIIIKGSSPDIIIDDNPNCQSFENKNLTDIFNEVLKPYDKGVLKQKISLQSKETYLYSVQYNESAFDFIIRNCIRAGEWWCYDGDKINIGELPEKEVELIYGIDLNDFDFSIKLQPSNFKFVSYGMVNEQTYNSSSASFQVDSQQNRYGKTALSKSDDVFPNERNTFFNQPIEEGNEQQCLDSKVRLEKEAKAARVFEAQGVSENLDLLLGCSVKIKGLSNDNSSEIDYGEYIIVSLKHTCNREGNYINYFEAIPSTIKHPPETELAHTSVCEEQSAVVEDVDDPEKMGRVRVRFPWQLNDELSPWLRIITASGGADKGIYFIPELGEEVLVGFENLNAEKPYIIGSFYNGKNKPDSEWVSSDNNFKAYRTRSGHTVIFSDEDGKEYIKIYDNMDRNAIRFNPNEKELKIWSEGDIIIEGKNILLSATDKIEMKADGEIDVKTKKDYTLEAMGSVKTKATKDNKTEALNIVNKASVKYSAQGAQSEVKGSAMTTIKGAIVKIN